MDGIIKLFIRREVIVDHFDYPEELFDDIDDLEGTDDMDGTYGLEDTDDLEDNDDLEGSDDISPVEFPEDQEEFECDDYYC